MALAERRHAANGIVFPDLSGPFYADVILGYEEVAAELGRSVLIMATRGQPDVAQLVMSLAGRVDGMVLFDPSVGEDVVREVESSGVPVVLLARPEVPGMSDIDTISTENITSAYELTQHLLGHGHRRIVFLGDPDSSTDAAHRCAGMSKALREAGARHRAVAQCGFDEHAGQEAARDLLSQRMRPDALMCFNDEIALGAFLAAEEAGLRVPDDIAITGWDDVMAARFVRPALTTVRQPVRALGAEAARALDQRITGARTKAVHTVLPTALVIRESCGPHPAPSDAGPTR